MSGNNYDFCIGTANSLLRKHVLQSLGSAGFISVGEAKSIPSFLRLLRTVQPWLAVLDTDLPPGNIQELAHIIENDGLAAAVYINPSGAALSDYVELKWPVAPDILIAVSKAVCSEFGRKKDMQKQIIALQQKLNERKLVERAKGLLINEYSLREEEAYRFLQRESMQQRLTMAEMAAAVIRNPGAFSALTQRR